MALARDPFDGLLERSTVAQTLRGARASLARPSRPFTPASRSLFQQREGGDEVGLASGRGGYPPRPSSSYSLDQLRFVKDTFAPPTSSCGSASGSTRVSSGRSGSRSGSRSGGSRSGSRSGSSRTGSRSGLRSRESLAASASAAELFAVPELEETEPELEQLPVLPPDIVTFGDGGEIISGSQGGGGEDGDDGATLQFDLEDPEFADGDEEYDVSGTAEDLAMYMGVPEPGSDEDSDDDGSGAHAPRQAAKASASSRVPPQKKDKGKAPAGGSKQSASPALLEATEALEAFGRDAINGVGEQLLSAVQDARVLISEVREGRRSDPDAHAPRLLRAVLSLMDAKVDSPCLFRLARCVIELLQVGSVASDVGARGTQATYLNIARALFKLSKDATNDARFREEGLLEPLLLMLGGGASSESASSRSSELCIFVVGVLKNVSNSEENQQHIVACGALPALLSLLRPSEGLAGTAQQAQLLIQVTALLRNLAGSSQRQRQLIELDALSALSTVSATFMSNTELQVNVARVFARLSTEDAACQALEVDPTPLQQAVHCLREHGSHAVLVLRLAFALGNVAAASGDLRQTLMLECDAVGVLPALLDRYWRQDRQLAASAEAAPAAAESVAAAAQQECEGVLVKLVRLVANSSIDASVGGLLASEPLVVSALLGALGAKSIQESEELVLSATAAVTNLLYYDDSSTNLLFTPENKQALCTLLKPMVLESYNVEALVEAVRALGNLSRHPDARQWIGELRIDEALCILLQHSDRDLVFYACGALVNLAADPMAGARLSSEEVGLWPKLGALLRDVAPEDAELRLVAIKVLSNLRLDSDAASASQWPKDEATLQLLRAGAQRSRDLAVSAVAAAGAEGGADAGEAPPPHEALAELAQRLLDALP